jgi:hypothetical protein
LASTEASASDATTIEADPSRLIVEPDYHFIDSESHLIRGYD